MRGAVAASTTRPTHPVDAQKALGSVVMLSQSGPSKLGTHAADEPTAAAAASRATIWAILIQPRGM
jgi:hypothetical protein